jgi:hypothetical protein
VAIARVCIEATLFFFQTIQVNHDGFCQLFYSNFLRHSLCVFSVCVVSVMRLTVLCFLSFLKLLFFVFAIIVPPPPEWQSHQNNEWTIRRETKTPGAFN